MTKNWRDFCVLINFNFYFFKLIYFCSLVHTGGYTSAISRCGLFIISLFCLHFIDQLSAVSG